MMFGKIRRIVDLEPQSWPPLAWTWQGLEDNLFDKRIADLDASDPVAPAQFEPGHVPVRPQRTAGHK